MKFRNIKTKIRLHFHVLLILIAIILPAVVLSQATISSNTRTSGSLFLGWNNFGLPGSLEIRNEFNGAHPIKFFTGGNAPVKQRMIILGNSGNGYVGIGSAFNTPEALLHVNGNAKTSATGEVFRTSGPGKDIINAWRMFTGADNGTEKLAFFVTPNAADPYNDNNATMQALEGNILFNPGGSTETMRIAGKSISPYSPNDATIYQVNPGNVGILTRYPLSLLHVGPEVVNGGSYRDWMYYGVLRTYQDMTSYLGMRQLSNDGEAETVLSWSNFYKQKRNSLKFIFTNDVALGNDASDREGIDVAQMESDGSATGSRMGIGGRPRRRLEAFDRGEDAPQLRLTYTYRNEFDGSTFTDFQTTKAGDLYIEPITTKGERNVGIGIFSPLEKIDVNGNGRFRNVPDIVPGNPNVLMIGQQSAAGSPDVTLRKLAFTGNSNDVLLGTGVFGPAPVTPGGVVTADNGLSLSTPSNVQLEVHYCMRR